MYIVRMQVQSSVTSLDMWTRREAAVVHLMPHASCLMAPFLENVLDVSMSHRCEICPLKILDNWRAQIPLVGLPPPAPHVVHRPTLRMGVSP